MTKLQQMPDGGKSTFVGAIGKGPARQTAYGLSRDVVRTDGEDRVWGDLIPTNPQVLDILQCGDTIEVHGVKIVKDGHRPMWKGEVAVLQK